MTKPFDHRMYEVARNALTEHGVPITAAERAAQVVASDEATQPNLGRTHQDQKDVSDAMTWYWAKQRNQEETKE